MFEVQEKKNDLRISASDIHARKSAHQLNCDDDAMWMLCWHRRTAPSSIRDLAPVDDNGNDTGHTV
jgi:hypothetical protein